MRHGADVAPNRRSMRGSLTGTAPDTERSSGVLLVEGVRPCRNRNTVVDAQRHAGGAFDEEQPGLVGSQAV